MLCSEHQIIIANTQSVTRAHHSDTDKYGVCVCGCGNYLPEHSMDAVSCVFGLAPSFC